MTARWRDTRRDEAPLDPFAKDGQHTTVRQLDDALREGASPGFGVLDRLGAWTERDIADLRPHLEARAAEAEIEAVAELAENGEREAETLAGLLRRQIERVRGAMQDKTALPQIAFDFRSDEQRRQAEKEQRQFEADRRSWDGKLMRLQADLNSEPAAVRDGYAVRARQLEPLGLIYLWPATN